jgi:ribose-phosphate pyrophosphokinase
MFKNFFPKYFTQKTVPFVFLTSFFTYNKVLKCEVVEEIDDDYFVADIKKFMKKYYLSPNSKKHSFILFSGNGNRELSQEVAKDLQATLGKVSLLKMDNGESFIKIHENVNNKNVIIIQSLSPPINENIMELMFLISALKRESAKKIIVVTPYFSYSRKPVPTEIGKVSPYAASVLMRLLEGLGVDQIIAIELHSKSITGFSKTMPIIDLDMVYVGASYFLEKIAKGEISSNPVVVSPDVNGAVRARKMKDILEISGIPAKIGFISDYKDSNKNM